MVSWIWIGGLIVLLGGFIAGWPTKRGHDAHRQRPLRRPRRDATCASPSASPA